MSAGQAQQPTTPEPPPPEPSQVVANALQYCAKAKSLQLRLAKLMEEYAHIDNKESIFVLFKYYFEIQNIISETREVRGVLQAYLMYLASKVPLNREEFLKLFTILNTVDFGKPESLINTVLSDMFIYAYINLLLSIQTAGTVNPSQSIVFQFPIPSAQQGTGGVKQ